MIKTSVATDAKGSQLLTHNQQSVICSSAFSGRADHRHVISQKKVARSVRPRVACDSPRCPCESRPLKAVDGVLPSPPLRRDGLPLTGIKGRRIDLHKRVEDCSRLVVRGVEALKDLVINGVTVLQTLSRSAA